MAPENIFASKPRWSYPRSFVEKLAERPGSPESLQQLVEVARNLAAIYAANATSFSVVSMGKEDNIKQAREKKAPGPSAASKEDYNRGTDIIGGFLWKWEFLFYKRGRGNLNSPI
ncbi:hypothetical protein U1Q18_031685, partial [Sarracenia purpurea var. burkii]